ncbi:MAG: oligosaccharide flippase family protein [Desulfobaccales bacterium]
MGRKALATKGFLVNILQYFLQSALAILLAPLLLRVAGQETLGAYAALMQAVGYLILLDLGFTFALNRYLAYATGIDDGGTKFTNVLNTGRTFLLGVGILYALAAVALAFGIGPLLKLSPVINSQARVAILGLAAWGVIRFPASVYGCSLFSLQDMAFRYISMGFANCLRLVASLGLVYWGFGLIGLVAAIIASEAVDFSVCFWRFKKLRPSIQTKWGIQDTKLFREMFSFSLQALLITIAGTFIFGTDKLIAGSLWGAAQASVYYTTQLPSFIGWSILTKVADNASPAINELYAKQDWQRLRGVYLDLYRYTLLLALPFTLGLIILNKYFMTLWVGPAQYGGIALTIWTAAFAFLVSISHISFVFLVASGYIRVYSKINLAEGLFNVGLCILLGWFFGLAGIAASIFLAHLINFSYVQWKIQTDLTISSKSIFSRCLLPSVEATMVSTIILICLINLINPTNWLKLLAIVALVLISHSLASFFLGLGRSERKSFLDLIFTPKALIKPSAGSEI